MSSSPYPKRRGAAWLAALTVGSLIVLAVAGGWWLGHRQRPGQPVEDPKRTLLQSEAATLRQRLDRNEASDLDRQRLLELLVALDRKAEAISLLEPMADREPDRWSLRLMLAELRRDQNDRAGAERELRMILSRQSDQVEALQLMTLLLLEQGRGAEADRRVQDAFASATRPTVRPEAMGVGLVLAELQQRQGQGRRAEATYTRLAELFPQDQRPLIGLAMLRQSRGDKPGAQQALAQARLRSPRGETGDPRLERLAAGWGLGPLRAPAASERRPGPPAGSPETAPRTP